MIELGDETDGYDGANYIVTINGRLEIPCETESEVWAAIGRQPFGSLYEVRSPVGLNCYDFIPF